MKQGEVILHVFLLRILLYSRLDSAVAERTVYPGFLLFKVLEVEWVVLIINCHTGIVAERRRFGRVA